jgi:DNA polymerase-3 subunit beta
VSNVRHEDSDRLSVRISTADLRAALATVGRATGPRRLGAHLDCVRLEARRGDLRMLCTDHCLTIEQTLRGAALADGEVLVPWSPLAELAQACPAPVCEIRELPHDRVLFRAGERNASLAAFARGRVSAETEPSVVAALGIFSGPALRAAIDTVSHAAATREAREALTGVLLRSGRQSLTLAATDGRRLVVHRVDSDRRSMGPLPDVIVPATHLSEVARCLLSGRQGAVHVSLSAARNVVYFDLGDVRLQSRLLDVSFPRFERVIAGSFLTKVAAPVTRLREDLRFVGTLLTRTSRLVTLEVQPARVLLRVTRRSSGDVAEAMISAHVWGEPLTVHLNHDDLLSVLDAMQVSTAVLGFNGPSGPCMVLPSGCNGALAALAPAVPSGDDVD